MAHNVVLLIFS